MPASLVITLIVTYFSILLITARLTAGKGDNGTFFTANRQSPWYLVAFGMIGASLSGVTFISVPGAVLNDSFQYYQVVLGYIVGYFVIGSVLLPLYYRYNLVSIYEFLRQRLGLHAYKTGAAFFLLSRTVGASFRLFLVATVLQLALFDAWGVPFAVTVAITIALIWLYTFRGGIKTIVWTDTLQTASMLAAVIVTLFVIARELDWGTATLIQEVKASSLSTIFNWDVKAPTYFWKQFFSGAFIAIVMTGLDQDMMQKNLTIRTLRDAQKNVFWFTVVLVIVNLIFLALGATLFLYAQSKGITLPEATDQVYPYLALNHFPRIAGVLFLIGIIAAAYSSADSALTALTTSFCVDFMGLTPHADASERPGLRRWVHLSFSVVLLLVILLFKAINDDAVIKAVFNVAGYTYGPLLGLFSFGLLTKFKIRQGWGVIVVCILAPVITYVLVMNSADWFGGYQIGFERLIYNGILTFIGLSFLIKAS
ncbi:MAG TPA: sodium:solute symporter [Cytophagales bacterium]|nr:sodium:solute symporter [Cytophagales bacterium]HAA20348.1 sodium:solute symporter [Cytophagales bacterium]